MSILEILANGEHVVAILIAISALIQIAPVKINPWSTLAEWIGKTVNGEAISTIMKEINVLHDDMKDMDKTVKDLRIECDIREAMLCRTRFMRFGDEVIRNINHTKDYFDQILCDITIYERYCKKNPDFEINTTNTEAIIKRIKEDYAKHLINDDFL